jgi:transaldolase
MPAGVYAPHQVLMAQAVGADYVAPYLGRMSDGDTTQLQLSHRELAFSKESPEPMEAVRHMPVGWRQHECGKHVCGHS